MKNENINVIVLFLLQEGTWTWQSGAEFEYSNWLGGRPLNASLPFAKSSNCLFLFGDNDNGKRPWLDVGCFQNIYPLCMKMEH